MERAATAANEAGPAFDLGRALRGHWRVAVAFALAFAVIATAVAAMQPKRYRAMATAVVRPQAAQMKPSDLLRGVDILSQPVILDTITALAPLVAPDAHAAPADVVDADVVASTTLFTITVEGHSPAELAAAANAIPAAIDAKVGAIFPMYRVALVSPASNPLRPVFPRVARAGITGLLFGAIAGAAIAALIDWRQRQRPA